MTPFRPPLNALCFLGLCLLLLAAALGQTARANEIRASDIPVEHLLSQLNQVQSQAELQQGPARFDFAIVNDTAEEALFYLRWEMLEPLRFSFRARGQPEPIFSSPFKALEQRSHASQGPVLRSDLIILAPGERLEIDATFERPPSPALFPISLVHKDAVDAQTTRRGLAHGAFFGAMMAFVVVFLLSPNFLMNAASSWFAAYLAFIALLSMHSHGYGLALLGLSPDSFFPIIRALQTGLILSYILFALSFLQAAQAYPRYWRAACIYIAFGLVVAALEQVFWSAEFRAVASIVAVIFLLLGSLGAFLALRDRVYGARYFATGFALLLVAGLVNFMASLPGFAAWNEAIDQATLALQVCDALVFGAALLSQMHGMRRARDEAQQAQMTEMRRRFDLKTKLLSTEGDLRRARDLAERHRANLAETSHDLRQPIASLRMSLEAAKERSPDMVSDLSAGIEFLDRLLQQTLVSTRAEAHGHSNGAQGEEDSAVALEAILLNVQRMFAQEAAQKGIALTVMPSTLVVRMPVIDLIRILSNLAANAVRHTRTGRVLIGARRRGGRAAIEVWDTGPGIPAEALRTITDPYDRGAGTSEAEGEGLGLAIAQQLIEKNGLELRVESHVGRGSRFAVEGLEILEEAPAIALTNK